MKYSRSLIFALLIAIALFFVGRYIFQHRIGYGAITYVNSAIPAGFQFTNEYEEIPDDLRVSSEYKTITQIGGIFSEHFTCQDINTSPKIVRYFQRYPGYGYSGGWSYRYAVICADQYLIVYGADHLGELLYGPFTTPK